MRASSYFLEWMKPVLYFTMFGLMLSTMWAVGYARAVSPDADLGWVPVRWVPDEPVERTGGKVEVVKVAGAGDDVGEDLER